MKKLFSGLIFLSLFFVMGVHAQTTTQTIAASWSIPTTRTDGSALAASELASYEIYYAVDGAGTLVPPDSVATVTPGSATSKLITLSLPPRVTPYKVYFAVSAIDTAGRKSPMSTIVVATVNVPIANPSAPGNFKILITCAAGTCTWTVQ